MNDFGLEEFLGQPQGPNFPAADKFARHARNSVIIINVNIFLG